jgi:hypothetical protein
MLPPLSEGTKMKLWPSISHRSGVVGERRRDSRKSTVIPAMLGRHMGDARSCTITDLNLTGIFVQMPDPSFPVGSELQILFRFDFHGNIRQCSEPVRVVRTTHDGLAVTFSHYDNQHQCNIQMMLHRAHHPYDSSVDSPEQRIRAH